MDSVARRLDDRGITWADIAYMGQAAAESGYFSNSYELRSRILTESMNLRTSPLGALLRRLLSKGRYRWASAARLDDDEPPY